MIIIFHWHPPQGQGIHLRVPLFHAKDEASSGSTHYYSHPLTTLDWLYVAVLSPSSIVILQSSLPHSKGSLGFGHYFNKYLLRVHFELGTVLGTVI